MSLGGTGSDDGNCGNSNNDALHRAICGSVAAGVTYVVAAGNDKATEITDAMRADMKLTTDAAAAEATKTGSKERVYYEIGYTDGTGEIFAPADKSFLAEMVTLAGADATREAIAAAAEHAAEGTSPSSDLNGQADYREHLATVLTRRAVTVAAGL